MCVSLCVCVLNKCIHRCSCLGGLIGSCASAMSVSHKYSPPQAGSGGLMNKSNGSVAVSHANWLVLLSYTDCCSLYGSSVRLPTDTDAKITKDWGKPRSLLKRRFITNSFFLFALIWCGFPLLREIGTQFIQDNPQTLLWAVWCRLTLLSSHVVHAMTRQRAQRNNGDFHI